MNEQLQSDWATQVGFQAGSEAAFAVHFALHLAYDPMPRIQWNIN
jgi:hypothetical protein